MGNRNSKSQEYQQFPGQKPPGPLNRLKGYFGSKQVNSGIPRSGMILPPRTSEFSNLQFILDNPPPIILQPQQGQPAQQAQTIQKLNAIKAKIIEYNRAWNFGNQLNGQPQSLLKKETYDNFLVFVTNLIKGVRNTSTSPPVTTMNANAISYQGKQNIVREIHTLVGAGGNQLVNEFFQVKISEIYPNIPGVNPEDTMMVNLLGLASIIGAEHIVIYLLMIGADPSLTKTDNRDSATLMLSFQIGFYKLLQQQTQFLKYFIIIPRILYILFLLGSIGEGVDLSAIFGTNEEKIKENNSKRPTVQVKSSILNMLAQMPVSSQPTVSVERQTLQNGGSIPLLLEILERNNSFKPKFFKDVNSLETPYDLNVLYSVLMNPNIDDQTKIRLIQLLVIKYCGNITNVPTFVVKATNISIFDIILLIVDRINTNRPQTKAIILEIFSLNEQFKNMLNASGIDLSKFINSNSTNNKNAIIRQLKIQIELLKQKNSLMTDKLEKFLENFYKTQVESSLASSQINSMARNAASSVSQVQPQIQQQNPTNKRFAQPGQPQIQLQNQRFAQPGPQQNPTTSLGQPDPKKSSFFPGLFSSKPINQQQLVPQSPQKSSFSSRLFGNTRGGQAGGKQIQMRTYHFLKHKKYSERAFIAERPIIAADNAYDFMKLHYDIGSKKITFTIHDRVNNKKYKYTARTLEDGTNVIKSAK
jgi:hypothetical protein